MKRTGLKFTRFERGTAFLLAFTMIASLVVGTGICNTIRGRAEEVRPLCGLEEHEHTDDCYLLTDGPYLVCEHNNGEYRHQHNTFCYDDQGNLRCKIIPVDEHIHSEECRQINQEFVCGMDLNTKHVHTSDCYVPSSDYNAYRTEYDEHMSQNKHTDECYKMELTCTEDHVHKADTCFTRKLACSYKDFTKKYPAVLDGSQEVYQVCGLTEADQEHPVHYNSCIRTEVKNICGKIDTSNVPAHTHTQECLSETARTLTPHCGLTEHKHTVDCYPEAKDIEPATVIFHDMTWEGKEKDSVSVKLGVTKKPDWFIKLFGSKNDGTVTIEDEEVPQSSGPSEEELAASITSDVIGDTTALKYIENTRLSDNTLVTDCVWHTEDGTEYPLSKLINEPDESITDLYTYTYRLSLDVSDVSEDASPVTVFSREGKAISSDSIGIYYTDSAKYTFTDSKDAQIVDLPTIIKNGLAENLNVKVSAKRTMMKAPAASNDDGPHTNVSDNFGTWYNGTRNEEVEFCWLQDNEWKKVTRTVDVTTRTMTWSDIGYDSHAEVPEEYIYFNEFKDIFEPYDLNRYIHEDEGYIDRVFGTQEYTSASCTGERRCLNFGRRPEYDAVAGDYRVYLPISASKGGKLSLFYVPKIVSNTGEYKYIWDQLDWTDGHYPYIVYAALWFAGNSNNAKECAIADTMFYSIYLDGVLQKYVQKGTEYRRALNSDECIIYNPTNPSDGAVRHEYDDNGQLWGIIYNIGAEVRANIGKDTKTQENAKISVRVDGGWETISRNLPVYSDYTGQQWVLFSSIKDVYDKYSYDARGDFNGERVFATMECEGTSSEPTQLCFGVAPEKANKDYKIFLHKGADTNRSNGLHLVYVPLKPLERYNYDKYILEQLRPRIYQNNDCSTQEYKVGLNEYDHAQTDILKIDKWSLHTVYLDREFKGYAVHNWDMWVKKVDANKVYPNLWGDTCRVWDKEDDDNGEPQVHISGIVGKVDISGVPAQEVKNIEFRVRVDDTWVIKNKKVTVFSKYTTWGSLGDTEDPANDTPCFLQWVMASEIADVFEEYGFDISSYNGAAVFAAATNNKNETHISTLSYRKPKRVEGDYQIQLRVEDYENRINGIVLVYTPCRTDLKDGEYGKYLSSATDPTKAKWGIFNQIYDTGVHYNDYLNGRNNLYSVRIDGVLQGYAVSGETKTFTGLPKGLKFESQKNAKYSIIENNGDGTVTLSNIKGPVNLYSSGYNETLNFEWETAGVDFEAYVDGDKITVHGKESPVEMTAPVLAYSQENNKLVNVRYIKATTLQTIYADYGFTTIYPTNVEDSDYKRCGDIDPNGNMTSFEFQGETVFASFNKEDGSISTQIKPIQNNKEWLIPIEINNTLNDVSLIYMPPVAEMNLTVPLPTVNPETGYISSCSADKLKQESKKHDFFSVTYELNDGKFKTIYAPRNRTIRLINEEGFSKYKVLGTADRYTVTSSKEKDIEKETSTELNQTLFNDTTDPYTNIMFVNIMSNIILYKNSFPTSPVLKSGPVYLHVSIDNKWTQLNEDPLYFDVHGKGSFSKIMAKDIAQYFEDYGFKLEQDGSKIYKGEDVIAYSVGSGQNIQRSNGVINFEMTPGEFTAVTYPSLEGINDQQEVHYWFDPGRYHQLKSSINYDIVDTIGMHDCTAWDSGFNAKTFEKDCNVFSVNRDMKTVGYAYPDWNLTDKTGPRYADIEVLSKETKDSLLANNSEWISESNIVVDDTGKVLSIENISAPVKLESTITPSENAEGIRYLNLYIIQNNKLKLVQTAYPVEHFGKMTYHSPDGKLTKPIVVDNQSVVEAYQYYLDIDGANTETLPDNVEWRFGYVDRVSGVITALEQIADSGKLPTTTAPENSIVDIVLLPTNTGDQALSSGTIKSFEDCSFYTVYVDDVDTGVLCYRKGTCEIELNIASEEEITTGPVGCDYTLENRDGTFYAVISNPTDMIRFYTTKYISSGESTEKLNVTLKAFIDGKWQNIPGTEAFDVNAISATTTNRDGKTVNTRLIPLNAIEDIAGDWLMNVVSGSNVYTGTFTDTLLDTDTGNLLNNIQYFGHYVQNTNSIDISQQMSMRSTGIYVPVGEGDSKNVTLYFVAAASERNILPMGNTAEIKKYGVNTVNVIENGKLADTFYVVYGGDYTYTGKSDYTGKDNLGDGAKIISNENSITLSNVTASGTIYFGVDTDLLTATRVVSSVGSDVTRYMKLAVYSPGVGDVLKTIDKIGNIELSADGDIIYIKPTNNDGTQKGMTVYRVPRTTYVGVSGESITDYFEDASEYAKPFGFDVKDLTDILGKVGIETRTFGGDSIFAPIRNIKSSERGTGTAMTSVPNIERFNNEEGKPIWVCIDTNIDLESHQVESTNFSDFANNDTHDGNAIVMYLPDRYGKADYRDMDLYYASDRVKSALFAWTKEDPTHGREVDEVNAVYPVFYTKKNTDGRMKREIIKWVTAGNDLNVALNNKLFINAVGECDIEYEPGATEVTLKNIHSYVDVMVTDGVLKDTDFESNTVKLYVNQNGEWNNIKDVEVSITKNVFPSTAKTGGGITTESAYYIKAEDIIAGYGMWARASNDYQDIKYNGERMFALGLDGEQKANNSFIPSYIVSEGKGSWYIPVPVEMKGKFGIYLLPSALGTEDDNISTSIELSNTALKDQFFQIVKDNTPYDNGNDGWVLYGHDQTISAEIGSTVGDILGLVDKIERYGDGTINLKGVRTNISLLDAAAQVEPDTNANIRLEFYVLLDNNWELYAAKDTMKVYGPSQVMHGNQLDESYFIRTSDIVTMCETPNVENVGIAEELTKLFENYDGDRIFGLQTGDAINSDILDMNNYSRVLVAKNDEEVSEPEHMIATGEQSSGTIKLYYLPGEADSVEGDATVPSTYDKEKDKILFRNSGYFSTTISEDGEEPIIVQYSRFGGESYIGSSLLDQTKNWNVSGSCTVKKEEGEAGISLKIAKIQSPVVVTSGAVSDMSGSPIVLNIMDGRGDLVPIGQIWKMGKLEMYEGIEYYIDVEDVNNIIENAEILDMFRGNYEFRDNNKYIGNQDTGSRYGMIGVVEDNTITYIDRFRSALGSTVLPIYLKEYDESKQINLVYLPARDHTGVKSEEAEGHAYTLDKASMLNVPEGYGDYFAVFETVIAEGTKMGNDEGYPKKYYNEVGASMSFELEHTDRTHWTGTFEYDTDIGMSNWDTYYYPEAFGALMFKSTSGNYTLNIPRAEGYTEITREDLNLSGNYTFVMNIDGKLTSVAYGSRVEGMGAYQDDKDVWNYRNFLKEDSVWSILRNNFEANKQSYSMFYPALDYDEVTYFNTVGSNDSKFIHEFDKFKDGENIEIPLYPNISQERTTLNSFERSKVLITPSFTGESGMVELTMDDVSSRAETQFNTIKVEDRSMDSTGRGSSASTRWLVPQGKDFLLILPYRKEFPWSIRPTGIVEEGTLPEKITQIRIDTEEDAENAVKKINEYYESVQDKMTKEEFDKFFGITNYDANFDEKNPLYRATLIYIKGVETSYIAQSATDAYPNFEVGYWVNVMSVAKTDEDVAQAVAFDKRYKEANGGKSFYFGDESTELKLPLPLQSDTKLSTDMKNLWTNMAINTYNTDSIGYDTGKYVLKDMSNSATPGQIVAVSRILKGYGKTDIRSSSTHFLFDSDNHGNPDNVGLKNSSTGRPFNDGGKLATNGNENPGGEGYAGVWQGKRVYLYTIEPFKYKMLTFPELKEMYRKQTFTYDPYPSTIYFDILRENKNYKMSKLWVRINYDNFDLNNPKDLRYYNDNVIVNGTDFDMRTKFEEIVNTLGEEFEKFERDENGTIDGFQNQIIKAITPYQRGINLPIGEGSKFCDYQLTSYEVTNSSGVKEKKWVLWYTYNTPDLLVYRNVLNDTETNVIGIFDNIEFRLEYDGNTTENTQIPVTMYDYDLTSGSPEKKGYGGISDNVYSTYLKGINSLTNYTENNAGAGFDSKKFYLYEDIEKYMNNKSTGYRYYAYRNVFAAGYSSAMAHGNQATRSVYNTASTEVPTGASANITKDLGGNTYYNSIDGKNANGSDGYFFNAANRKNSVTYSTHGLVKSLKFDNDSPFLDTTNGKQYSKANLAWHESVAHPSYFDESNYKDGSDVKGKHVYDNKVAIFNRRGDTFSLSTIGDVKSDTEWTPVKQVVEDAGGMGNKYSYNGIEWGNPDYTVFENPKVDGGLQQVSYTFNNKSVTEKRHTHIYTNSFWPMDQEAADFDSNGKATVRYGVDPLFGGEKRTLYYKELSDYQINHRSEYTSFQPSDDGLPHNPNFGMQFTTAFTIPEGYIGPLDFFIFGDDDIWIFMDGELICDVGGVHNTIGQYINLWDYIRYDNDLYTYGEDTGTHRLDFYFMERGCSGSTCYIQFTLPVDQEIRWSNEAQQGAVEITKTLNNPEEAYDKEFRFNIKVQDSDSEDASLLGQNISYAILDKDGDVLDLLHRDVEEREIPSSDVMVNRNGTLMKRYVTYEAVGTGNNRKVKFYDPYTVNDDGNHPEIEDCFETITDSIAHEQETFYVGGIGQTRIYFSNVGEGEGEDAQLDVFSNSSNVIAVPDKDAYDKDLPTGSIFLPLTDQGYVLPLIFHREGDEILLPEFTLEPGQKMYLSRLTLGSKVTVTELNSDKYFTEFETNMRDIYETDENGNVIDIGTKGTGKSVSVVIDADKLKVVNMQYALAAIDFINTPLRGDPELPRTGGFGTAPIYILASMLILTPITLLEVRRRRRRNSR